MNPKSRAFPHSPLGARIEGATSTALAAEDAHLWGAFGCEGLRMNGIHQ
jgi:hypothetical protein